MNRIPAFLIPLALMTACDAAPDNTASRAAFLAEEHITLAEAIAIAEAEVPGAEAVEAELEVEDGEEDDDDGNEAGDDDAGAAYEVELLDGMEKVEVEIDAVTGAVLEVERGEDDDD
jgi:uncharacterized membrane protein YkoI